MKTIIKKLITHIDGLLFFIFCLFVFSYIVEFVYSDIQAHMGKIIEINTGESAYPPNFLFYFLVNLLSGFPDSTDLLDRATVMVLSLATVSKYIISKNIIASELRKIGASGNKIYLIAVGLFFCFAIPDPYLYFVLDRMYLGKFVPWVWHNSTTIMLFPFAILLFWKQYKILQNPNLITLSDAIAVSTLVAINLFIKPSFIFTYLPVTFFFIIAANKKSSHFNKILLHLTPILTAILIIPIQYYFIYILQAGAYENAHSGISFGAPFAVLSGWIPAWFIPVSFVLSYALPLYSMIAYKAIFRYIPFSYALALSIVGLGISAFITETGPRMSHGNFMWQNYICAFLVFLTTASFLSQKFLTKKNRSRKDIIAIGFFLLHALSGVLYLVKLLVTRVYS